LHVVSRARFKGTVRVLGFTLAFALFESDWMLAARTPARP
jgi:hypothetical protein